MLLSTLDSMNTQLHETIGYRPYEFFGQKPCPVVFYRVEGVSMVNEEDLARSR